MFKQKRTFRKTRTWNFFGKDTANHEFWSVDWKKIGLGIEGMTDLKFICILIQVFRNYSAIDSAKMYKADKYVNWTFKNRSDEEDGEECEWNWERIIRGNEEKMMVVFCQ